MVAAHLCERRGEEERVVSTRGCFVYAKFNTDPLPSPPPLSPSLLLADLLFKSGGEWRLSGARVNQSTRLVSPPDIFFTAFFLCAAVGGRNCNFYALRIDAYLEGVPKRKSFAGE